MADILEKIERYKRAEIAANKAADGRGASPARLSAGVRNPGDCVVCHGPTGGYIQPTNIIKQLLDLVPVPKSGMKD